MSYAKKNVKKIKKNKNFKFFLPANLSLLAYFFANIFVYGEAKK